MNVKFGNKEEIKTLNFTLTEKPETNEGEISGYIYEDTNSNGIKETTEKTMAGWKVCIDQNNNNYCEEQTEPFILTNNQGYYEFNGLVQGIYKIYLMDNNKFPCIRCYFNMKNLIKLVVLKIIKKSFDIFQKIYTLSPLFNKVIFYVQTRR